MERGTLRNSLQPLSAILWRLVALLSLSSASRAFEISHITQKATLTTLHSTLLPETAPLPPHTFAGLVEQGLRQRFGNEVDRVVESWRLLDRGYEHHEQFGADESTRFRQHCHSYVPGLTVKEFWNPDHFEWCAKLQAKYPQIRKEFLSVTADMDRLTRQGNNIWAGALTEDASSYGEGWRTLVLMDRGRWDEVNVNLFPMTAKAVYDSGVPAVEVFFASMQPHTEIKPHSDFTNFVLTSHLAVDIPYSGEKKCRLRIGDTTREWRNGELMLFDTSVMHDAVNESDKTRSILMLRLWHPDLTEKEKAALQFTYDCLEFPGLVSTSAEEQFLTERQAEAMRAFPEIKKSVQGFGDVAAKSKKKRQGRK